MSTQMYLIIMLNIIVMTIVLTLLIAPKVLKKEYEKVKIDVSAESMRDLEKRIKELKQQYKLDVDADLYSIAKVLRIQKGAVQEDLKVQAHISNADVNGYSVVTFKKGLGAVEQRFAFAHECAHVINGDMQPNDRKDGKNKSQQEQLADYVAAALLMPYETVNEILQNTDYIKLKKTARLKIVREMCKQFDVSEIIALRRVNEVLALNAVVN